MLVYKHKTICILRHPRFLLKKRGIMGLVISKKCEYEIEKKIGMPTETVYSFMKVIERKSTEKILLKD